MSGDLDVAIAAAERAFEIADAAVVMAEEAAIKFGRVVGLVEQWKAAAMLFYEYHNGEFTDWGTHNCGCDRCVVVEGLLGVGVTSLMVE